MAQLEHFLQKFLIKEPEPAQLTRISNPTYQMHDQKFLIHRKAKDAMLQYATLYFLRLEKLRPAVKESSELKWNKAALDNILDIKPYEDTVIIGTLFKEQKLKPSILNNIMGVLGHKKFVDADGHFKHGMYVNHTEDDVAVLEDISGRITIKNSANFNINSFVSGTILALKGKAIAQGYFEVEDYCFAGAPFRKLPTSVQIPQAKQSELYSGERKLVAFVSGLQIGSLSTSLSVQMLSKFLRGEFPDQKTRKLSSQIQRLIVVGDSIIQPGRVDEVLRGSYRTAELNKEVYENINTVLEKFEQFLDEVSETMDVDVMPGEQDFSNAFLPQQPLNSCLFPQLEKTERPGINLVTNPHQFEIEGLNFLGTSGQNIRDMLLNSELPDKNESEKCLHRIKQTLEMRHICPTAPDTLRIYPFKDSDPFIISENSSQLSLTQHEQQAESQYIQVPHVYFVGNMPAFGEELLSNKKGEYLKVISLPQFATSQMLVLLDMNTLETFQVLIGLSNELQSLGIRETVPEQSQESIERQMDMEMD